jgi:hypothetical protein
MPYGPATPPGLRDAPHVAPAPMADGPLVAYARSAFTPSAVNPSLASRACASAVRVDRETGVLAGEA